MGLLNDILTEVGETVDQKIGQGAAEMAAALFSNSDGFVQYGEGQKSPEVDRAPDMPVVEQPAIQEQSQGMEM
jgi:hypothetical protein